MAWQLLLVCVTVDLYDICTHLCQGYLPLPTSLRVSVLTRKRSEYQNMVDLAFAKGREGLDQQIWHQIEIDVPRTRPGVRLWMLAASQRVRLFIKSPLVLRVKINASELGTHSLCMGNSTSCQRVRARNK